MASLFSCQCGASPLHRERLKKKKKCKFWENFSAQPNRAAPLHGAERLWLKAGAATAASQGGEGTEGTQGRIYSL